MICDLVQVGEDKKSYQFDMALIHLNRLSLKMSQLKTMAGFKIENRYNLNAYVSGFPDFMATDAQPLKAKLKEAGLETNTILKDDVGKITKVVQNYIYYVNLKTITGQSGGPIMTQIDNKLYIIGMHCQYSPWNKTGKGIYFNERIWSTLREWAYRLNINFKPCSFLYYNDLVKQGERKQETSDEKTEGKGKDQKMKEKKK